MLSFSKTLKLTCRNEEFKNSSEVNAPDRGWGNGGQKNWGVEELALLE